MTTHVYGRQAHLPTVEFSRGRFFNIGCHGVEEKSKLALVMVSMALSEPIGLAASCTAHPHRDIKCHHPFRAIHKSNWAAPGALRKRPLMLQCTQGMNQKDAPQRDKLPSLIPDTLEEMAETREAASSSSAGKVVGNRTGGREHGQRADALEMLGVEKFDKFCSTRHGLEPICRGSERLSTLQVNVGLYCNMACSHCHVEASPLRKDEQMDRPTAERLVEVMKEGKRTTGLETLDLTGGAPELNPNFRFLVSEARKLNLHVIDRSNLTVLFEPEAGDDIIDFLATSKVHIVASLPCYSEENVDKQRGRGVFDRSIKALQELNVRGYGLADTGLVLDLVYNPVGSFLPPSQPSLENAYKKELLDNFGIRFNNLLTITNMPIKRFADYLHRSGETALYMGTLVDNFNASTHSGVMCRDMISVDHKGALYDCDFNQQLGMRTLGHPRTIFEMESMQELLGDRVATENHCFGCTAGAGSSCGGALDQ